MLKKSPPKNIKSMKETGPLGIKIPQLPRVETIIDVGVAGGTPVALQ